jgi:hypothetical protein
MVALKYLLLGAAAIFGVAAQEPTGDEAEAAAFWDDSTPGAEGAPAEKREVAFAHMPRNDPPHVIKDPYKGFYCHAKYTLPPCATTCNRNNCFRAFLNARDGSDGKVCLFTPNIPMYTMYIHLCVYIHISLHRVPLIASCRARLTKHPPTTALPHRGLRLLLQVEQGQRLAEVVGGQVGQGLLVCAMDQELQEQQRQLQGRRRQAQRRLRLHPQP